MATTIRKCRHEIGYRDCPRCQHATGGGNRRAPGCAGGPAGALRPLQVQDQPWLSYNFEGFPLVSSLAKLTMMQNDIRLTESDVLTTLLGKELELESGVTESNYITLLNTEKGAYYQGETFDVGVNLGRKGGALSRNGVELTLDGRKLGTRDYELIPGGVKLKVQTGSPGDHQIKGNLVFLNEGVESKIPVDQTFAVISKPNAAVIAADKMNVVYRGVENPMTISFAGVPDSNVKVSAPGLRSASGQGKYIINPPSGSQNLIVNVTATLDDGTKVNSKKSFRIKNIPNPVGKIAGKSGSVKLNKRDVTTSRVLADFGDFVYDLNPTVSAFDLTVLGETVTVSGNRLNPAAKALINNAPRRSLVIIDNIKVRVKGVSGVEIPPAAAITVKLTN